MIEFRCKNFTLNMGLKKNFIYNTVLLISQYIIPLIVFPHISRVFGVEKIGLVNFVDSIINYFILFSTMGLTLVGIREIAKNKHKSEDVSKVFSELLFVHLIMTTIASGVLILCILFYDKFKENQNLYFIGISKLLFNVFIIEWFFRGIENFKFITIRSIIIKVVYVIALFVFVRQKEDISIYFALTCGVTVANGFINCWYAAKYTKLVFKGINLKKHLKSFFSIGLHLILNSMYTTFNVAYLGIIANDKSVGYYTTSLKLYTIILGFFSAVNIALVPRLSSLFAEGNTSTFQQLINKAFLMVCTLSFPIIMCATVLAPLIIQMLSGNGYGGAVICFRIIMPLTFIVGIAQILSNQILMSLKKDKELIITSFFGALIGVTFNITLVPAYHEVGTAFVVLISELSVTLILFYFCSKHTEIQLPLRSMFINLVISIPYLLICYLTMFYFHSSLIILIVAGGFSLIYFMISQLFWVKNELITRQIYKMYAVILQYNPIGRKNVKVNI